jgi:hypothetical protein
MLRVGDCPIGTAAPDSRLRVNDTQNVPDERPPRSCGEISPETRMSLVTLHVGPAWPPDVSEYDDMKPLARPDWAWEILRRNPDYQADAAAQRIADRVHSQLAPGVFLTRMLPAEPKRARSWGVCSFR